MLLPVPISHSLLKCCIMRGMESHNSRASLKPPRHIVWDWNGTLSNDVQAAVNGINLLLAERKLPLVNIEKHRCIFDFPVRNYYAALGFQLENEDWDAMAKKFTEAFLTDESARLFDGASEALRRLSEAGIAMSVLSACEESALNAALERHAMRDLFVAVRGLRHNSADSKLGIAKKLFTEIGQPFDDVWMIGDTTHDNEVASAAGCRCLLLSDGYQSRQRLLNTGVPVLNNVTEVPSFFGI